MDKGLQREDCGPPKEKEGFRMKRGLVWVLALALMLTLAGCGAASGETAATPDFSFPQRDAPVPELSATIV